MILVWLLLFGWRSIFAVVFPVSGDKEDVLIIGAGRPGMALLQVLERRGVCSRPTNFAPWSMMPRKREPYGLRKMNHVSAALGAFYVCNEGHWLLCKLMNPIQGLWD